MNEEQNDVLMIDFEQAPQTICANLPPDGGERKFDVLATLLAGRRRFGADAHHRQCRAGQAQMVVADQAALLGQALALHLHRPNLLCVGGRIETGVEIIYLAGVG